MQVTLSTARQKIKRLVVVSTLFIVIDELV